MKYQTFLQPLGFDPAPYWPEGTRPPASRWEANRLAARYLIHLLIRKAIQGEDDEQGWIPLKAEYLRQVMGKRYWEVIDVLEKHRVIDVDRSYEPGKRSCRYRLLFQATRHVEYRFCDRRIVEAVEKAEQRIEAEQDKLRSPTIRALHDMQRSCLGVLPGIQGALDALPASSQLSQRAIVSNIQTRTPTNVVGAKGRRWSNGITGLKRNLRDYVVIDGSPISCVDLRASQPALLAMLLSLEYPTRVSDLPSLWTREVETGTGLSLPTRTAKNAEDVSRFVDIVCYGTDPKNECEDLYRLLAMKSGWGTGVEARDRAKAAFLRDVLAWTNDYKTPTFRWAAVDTFPTVVEFIERLREQSKLTPIAVLQRLESWFVLEQVCPRLLDRCSIVPLHDSIFSSRRNLPLVRRTFEETKQELGLQIRFSDAHYPKGDQQHELALAA